MNKKKVGGYDPDEYNINKDITIEERLEIESYIKDILIDVEGVRYHTSDWVHNKPFIWIKYRNSSDNIEEIEESIETIKLYLKSIGKYPNIREHGSKKSHLYNKGVRTYREIYIYINSNPIDEKIVIPVNVGDTIYTGRFKNRKTVIKSIGEDEYGMPTINNKKIVNFRKFKKKKNESFLNETYYEDLTPYVYGRNGINKVNIGWLDKEDFPKGNVDKRIIDKIKSIKSSLVYKGSHSCPFCGKERTNVDKEVKGEKYTYVFPGLLAHYIEEHKYLPPKEFLDAVDKSIILEGVSTRKRIPWSKVEIEDVKIYFNPSVSLFHEDDIYDIYDSFKPIADEFNIELVEDVDSNDIKNQYKIGVAINIYISCLLFKNSDYIKEELESFILGMKNKFKWVLPTSQSFEVINKISNSRDLVEIDLVFTKSLNEDIVNWETDNIKNFFNKSKEKISKYGSISFDELRKVGKEFDVDIIRYNEFYDMISDEQRKNAPPSTAMVFGLCSPKTNNVCVVIKPDNIDKSLIDYIYHMLKHENIHLGQTKRKKKVGTGEFMGNVSNKKEYFSNKDEVMAFSQSISDMIMKMNPISFEKSIQMIKHNHLYRDIKGCVGQDILKRYKKYIYLYLKKEFEKI